jgi:hypothetical protein
MQMNSTIQGNTGVGIKVQNFQALIDDSYTHRATDERNKSCDPVAYKN